jgi:predicted nucleic acid-binding protein
LRPRLVLDASAAVHLVLAGPHAPVLLDQLEDAVLILVPDLFPTETANALWKYVKAGDLSAEKAIELLRRALALVDVLVPAPDLAVEALAMAAQAGHPVYDFLYVVLARRNGAPLLTMDRSLANRLQGAGIEALCPLLG